VISLIKTREGLLEMVEADEAGTKDKLSLIIGDDEKAMQVVEAAKTSMGIDINEMDTFNIIHFTFKIKRLIALRQRLHD